MHDCVSVLVCMDISIDEFEGNIAQKESKELAPFPSSSAKSAYYIALNVLSSLGGGGGSRECSHGYPKTPLWKKMWHLKIPPKIRIFM